MGKATILGSGDKNLKRGQYKVRIEKSDSRVTQELKRISAEITGLDDTISNRYSEYNAAQTLYNRSKSDLNAIIQQSKESPASDYSEKLQSVTVVERTSYNTLASSKSRYQAARLKQRSLRGKKLYLDSNITEDIRTVWCADCQRNLSGTVATIEVPNTDDIILIRPGGADGSGANYSASRDGQLRSVASMSPAEAAWNYTMLPGWQKFKPLYRLGKITSRPPGNGKCSVLLDAYSTVQGLATDVERNLKNVPMLYKNRDDGGPYVVGDRVVVEFYNQNREAPRVVGFEDYPCTTSSSTTSSSTTTAPPDIPGIFQMASVGGTLYKYAGWTNTVYETSGNPIGGRWYAACLGPDGMIAAEWQLQNKLYQFSGVSTVVDSVIGSIAGTTIYGLYYDADTTNLTSISPNKGTLTIYNGISVTVSSTITFPYADSWSGFVSLSGVCSYAGDLILSVYWFSLATSVWKAQLWRMDGYSNTLKGVLADYSHIWNAVLSNPFVYTGGFAFHIFGLDIMLKFEVSPPGPGVVINNFAPGWPGVQYIGGGYVE